MKQSATPASRVIRFGVFEVDPRSGELRKHGIRIRLQDQPYQILAILLDHPGEIVSREEIRERLWPGDTFVNFDHSLNTAVMRLREALSDSSDNPRFIETIPRRGYRFIAPLGEYPALRHEKVPIPAPEPIPFILKEEPPAQRAPGWQDKLAVFAGASLGRLLLLALALLFSAGAMIGAGVWYFKRPVFGSSQGRPIKSLVVLPLENLSGDREQDYFADGMTDDLIAHLAKIRSLRVISRTSAMGYKGTHRSLSDIARELHVDAVVEGTVLRSGNRVRITAELVQVSTDTSLWADSYESQFGDVLSLQGQVVSAIVNEIRVKLTPEEQERLVAPRTVSAQSYENYLKGRYYWNKRSEEGLTKAIDYFQLAVKQDPRYALAYAGLADCYSIIGSAIVGTVPAADVAPKARAAAQKSLELDENLAEAQTSLATVRFNYDWDWAAAEKGFQRAIELNPSYATAYQRYSLYLIAMGHADRSIAEMNRARELDPLSISTNFSLGWRLYMARQYDPAIEQLRNTIDMDPSFTLPHLVLGQAYEQKGRTDEAIAELQKAASISHDSPPILGVLGHVYGVAGKTADAEKILAQLGAESTQRYVSPFYIALVYAGLGENDKAIDNLEKAYQDRSNGVVFLKVDPQLDGLRASPRFQALLRRLAPSA